ncbi:MAG: tRNA (adenosine(37)-N6)-threonylcarbamoyltransferase complex dimerization subunit type 1 TsaB [Solirubrobacteraceae bacterium]
MIVLGLDTATVATVVGLTLADGSTLQARDDPTGEQRPGHATRLLPLANELLVEAGLSWSELERISVGVGPGTFTGLRIGIATARGLSQSLGVRLVGVSSLRALAYGVSGNTTTEAAGTPPVSREDMLAEQDSTLGAGEGTGVLAVIDARRGEAFVAAYDGDIELIAPHALSPSAMGGLVERAAARTNLEHWIAVGDGALRYRDALERPGVVVPSARAALHQIQARAICALGACAPEDDAQVVPDYRRRPDAEIALEGASS